MKCRNLLSMIVFVAKFKYGRPIEKNAPNLIKTPPKKNKSSLISYIGWNSHNNETIQLLFRDYFFTYIAGCFFCKLFITESWQNMKSRRAVFRFLWNCKRRGGKWAALIGGSNSSLKQLNIHVKYNGMVSNGSRSFEICFLLFRPK